MKFLTPTILSLVASIVVSIPVVDSAGNDPRTVKHRSEEACKRGKVYSVVDPNNDWVEKEGREGPFTVFHPQVWYHSLKDIYKLWQKDYFDYVLDIRPLEDGMHPTVDDLFLDGWETKHIPGSYPLDLFGQLGKKVKNIKLLSDFASSDACLDSRIFLHCWSGVSANMAAPVLIEMGFTNIHVAGPEGKAGIWEWEAQGYPVAYNDKFKKNRKPKCQKKCD